MVNSWILLGQVKVVMNMNRSCGFISIKILFLIKLYFCRV